MFATSRNVRSVAHLIVSSTIHVLQLLYDCTRYNVILSEFTKIDRFDHRKRITFFRACQKKDIFLTFLPFRFAKKLFDDTRR